MLWGEFLFPQNTLEDTFGLNSHIVLLDFCGCFSGVRGL